MIFKYAILRLWFHKHGYVLILCQLATIFQLSIIEANASDKSYEVIGTIKNISPDGRVLAQHRFDAKIEGCKWIIRTSFLPTSGITGISYLEDSFDGTTVYSYIQFTNVPSTNTSTSAGIIEENNVPYEKSNYATLIWLAFGSSCYFKEIKDNKVKLFFNLNDSSLRLQNYMVRVDWKRSKEPPVVPIYANFYDDGFVYSLKKNTSVSYQRQPPYEKGFISYKYRVVVFTNVGGITIPAMFQMESYMPKPNGKTSADLTKIFTQVGLVESVNFNPHAESFVPKIDAATYVEDRRFASFDPPIKQIFYYDTSGVWLATSSKAVMNVYRQDLQDEGTYTTSISSKYIRIIFCFVFFLPLLVIIFIQWKRRTK